MSYNESLSERVRTALTDIANMEEKRMFGGICFMINDKMCMGVSRDELMCRIGPENYASALKKPGCREMDFTGRPMIGYVFVKEEAIRSKKQLEYWIDLCLKFNVQAKSFKKKRKN